LYVAYSWIQYCGPVTHLFLKASVTFRQAYIEVDYCFCGQNFVVGVSVFESDFGVSELLYFVAIHQFSALKRYHAGQTYL